MAEDKFMDGYAEAEAAEALDAAADLERVEEEIVEEAENAVEVDDAAGDAQAAAEAAETAFDFEEAEKATDAIKHDMES